jgi:hypothetical protein
MAVFGGSTVIRDKALPMFNIPSEFNLSTRHTTGKKIANAEY